MKIQCPLCLKSPGNNSNIVRNGSYFRKSDSQQLSRFYCKACKKSFSTATYNSCFGQKRRRLNEPLYKLLCSGVSLRRSAIILGCNYKTVCRKLEFLADRSKERLQNRQHLPVQRMSFDDVETFEHTKCKPLSITMAVCGETRRILDFEVSPIAAKGHLAAVALKKYGFRKSLRGKNRAMLFKRLQTSVSPYAEILSDKDPHYPRTVKKFFPKSTHITSKGRRGCVTGQGELKAGKFDPLFSFNHTAAMLRYCINRLVRRTWCTTKKIEGLKNHLYLYMDFHNTKLIQQLPTPTA